MEEEALDRIMWRTGFGRGYGSVARHYLMTGLLRIGYIKRIFLILSFDDRKMNAAFFYA